MTKHHNELRRTSKKNKDEFELLVQKKETREKHLYLEEATYREMEEAATARTNNK